MTRKIRVPLFSAIALAVLLFFPGGQSARADEGMWTFDNPPLKQLKERYGFAPTQEWLDHLRLSSLRFMDGGSGAFISPRGLILTNHHVAMEQLQKMSTAERNYVATGFLARTLEEEVKCADLEVNVVISTEEVTARVKAAVREGMSDAEALKARQAEIAAIEKDSLDKTGLRSNVVDLYHGGEYWLYRYKKYTDVRLVMAPERQAAFYGGDADNFTYPRYDLDMAYFRAYENGKPVERRHFLRWNPRGLKEGDLVFASGNPGSTDRLYTYARLEYLRDIYYPIILKFIDRYLQSLRQYAARGQEEQRRALGQIFVLENSRKALSGEYQGLLDEEIMAKKKRNDEEFRKSLIDGGEKAVRQSKDPAIELMSRLDPMLRESEKWARENIESVLTSAGERIAKARFAVYGKTVYPDATFTLRLAYGTAVGYPMNGTVAPYMTTLYGLYDRALGFGNTGDFALPQRFWDRRERLDLSTPVNFVSTCDAVGGSSGSPVVNTKGELVGLVFDGNIESLVGNFIYDEAKNRTVSVHCAYMLEGLRKLYDAAGLAAEIMPPGGN